MTRFLIACLVFAIVFLAAGYATAQAPPCGPVDKIVAQLTGPKWREREFIVLTNKEGTMAMQIFMNPETQAWSQLSLNVQTGIACFIATGEGFFMPGKKKLEPKASESSL